VNDKTLSRICLLITTAGLVLFLFTYQEEFKESTIAELTAAPGAKGVLHGRIEYVQQNYPISLFTLNDGNTATIYAPKALAIEKNEYVKVYAENQIDKTNGSLNKKILAHKVVKE
jgi:hypothetical protein